MRDLYSRADAVLRGADPEAISAGSAIEAQHLVREGQPPGRMRNSQPMLSNLPVSYWTSFDAPSQIAHAKLSRGFRQQEVPILIDLRPDASKRITEMTVLALMMPVCFRGSPGQWPAPVSICGGQDRHLLGWFGS